MNAWQKALRILAAVPIVLCLVRGAAAAAATAAGAPFITLASTTSTQNCGLFDYILPKFKAATGIAVRVVAVGAGAAPRLARNGDARLRNQYGVILVSPLRHGHVKSRPGKRFIDWLLSGPGKAAIAGYKIGGRPLFYPN